MRCWRWRPGQSRLCVSTFELDGPERQYTVDTLAHFRSQLWRVADLFFVMGADSWAEITTWREWQRLLTLANLIVVTRPGFEVVRQHGLRRRRLWLMCGATEVGASNCRTAGAQKVFVTDAVMLDVSATAVQTSGARESRREVKCIGTARSGGLHKKVPVIQKYE